MYLPAPAWHVLRSNHSNLLSSRSGPKHFSLLPVKLKSYERPAAQPMPMTGEAG